MVNILDVQARGPNGAMQIVQINQKDSALDEIARDDGLERQVDAGGRVFAGRQETRTAAGFNPLEHEQTY